MTKRVRLADIADKVGVSAKTVSNVVNGTGWVSDPVRDKVRAAIEELGYRPNLAARHLRGGNSGLIALCVPTLAEPYFAEFAARLVDVAQARRLTVIVTQTKGDRDVERAMLEGENLPALDGIVLSPIRVTPEDVAARRSSVPLVLIGEHGEALATPRVTHVGPDNIAAAAAATAHLLGRGRRRIAVIGLQEPGADTARMRLRGYEQALAAAGVPLDPQLLVEVDLFNRAEGSRAVDVLLERGVEMDAIFCFNDSLAFGAMHTLAAHGVRIPDDVAVLGYDNIDEGRFTVPALSSVDPGVAAASAMILDTLLDPAHPTGGHVTVPFEVVERRT